MDKDEPELSGTEFEKYKGLMKDVTSKVTVFYVYGGAFMQVDSLVLPFMVDKWTLSTHFLAYLLLTPRIVGSMGPIAVGVYVLHWHVSRVEDATSLAIG